MIDDDKHCLDFDEYTEKNYFPLDFISNNA